MFPQDPDSDEKAMLAQAHDLSDCSNTNYWCANLNHTILDVNGWPDLIIESPFIGARHPELEAAALEKGIPIIKLTMKYSTEDAQEKGFIEIIQRFEELARALGVSDVTAAAAQDKAALCAEIESFKPVALQAQSRGVRAMAGYLPYGAASPNGNIGGWLATPDKDPVLMMLEELGMPIMHSDTTFDDYWENMGEASWKASDENGISATGLTSTGGRTGGRVKVPCEPPRRCDPRTLDWYSNSAAHTCLVLAVWRTDPVDFWLYDARVTLDFTSSNFAAAWPHPAVVAKQYAQWPANGHLFSYRHATTVLASVREKLAVAQKLDPLETTCTAVDQSNDEYRGLAPGEYACYNPVSYAMCLHSPPPLSPPLPPRPPPPPPRPPPPPSPPPPSPSPPPAPISIPSPVVLTMTARGSVSDYADTSALRGKFATAAGVDAALVTIAVEAGSVLITATIAVPTSTTAAAVQASLTASLGTAASASAALGITVESDPVIAEQSSPLTDTASNIKDDGIDDGAVAGIAVGCLFVGLLIGAGAVFLRFKWNPIIKRHKSFEVDVAERRKEEEKL